MKYVILLVMLGSFQPSFASADRGNNRIMQRVNTSNIRNGKKFQGAGPFSFDYLLGVNEFRESPFDVIFIDYDISAKDVKKYIDAGKSVICYVNVGAWEKWRSDAGKFPSKVLGKDYEGWPGEKWLDIRQLDKLLPIMKIRFETAKRKGCHGIDPDNMNGYTEKTGFSLSYDNQIAYNVAISKEIRSLGMLAGLKNDNDQAKDLVDFCDFAVLESCAVYDECKIMDIFIQKKKPVFAIEYTDKWNEKTFKKDVCPLVGTMRMSFILKEVDLSGKYVVSCI